ncbi:ATP-binding protein [Spirosoma aerolatum]|uniref:ATP-binding protein n=1 Tax=Spirosoma aerolatum TaxID=1211326 RepID=UPI0009AE58F4|nr:ATP-binding protein [Spirosoma aerolatum]
MVTEQQKHQIARLIELEAERQGSWQRAATRLGANQVTLRYNMQQPELWNKVSEAMWVKVAGKLEYNLNDEGWHLVKTQNVKIMMNILDRAQNEQLFMAVSHPAGHGKTAGIRMYRQEKYGVFYVECEESWSHKRFVQKLAEELGISVERYSVSELTDMIVDVLRDKASTTRPLLIIDEANKLKPSSLRLFIPLFNKLQDQIGMVLVGAHDLKRIILNGVRRDARGMDELASRLGRSFVDLQGIFEQDVKAICNANGLTDSAAQQRIWQRLMPTRQEINGKYYWVATQDLRVLKQAVKHEKATLRLAAQGNDGKLNPTEMESAMGGRVVELAA